MRVSEKISSSKKIIWGSHLDIRKNATCNLKKEYSQNMRKRQHRNHWLNLSQFCWTLFSFISDTSSIRVYTPCTYNPGRTGHILQINAWLNGQCCCYNFNLHKHRIFTTQHRLLGRNGSHILERGNSVFASKLPAIMKSSTYIDQGMQTKVRR